MHRVQHQPAFSMRSLVQFPSSVNHHRALISKFCRRDKQHTIASRSGIAGPALSTHQLFPSARESLDNVILYESCILINLSLAKLQTWKLRLGKEVILSLCQTEQTLDSIKVGTAGRNSSWVKVHLASMPNDTNAVVQCPCANIGVELPVVLQQVLSQR